MYTDPEVLQHECGDQRKMNLCLRFLFSSVSCKTRILSPVSNFHFIIGVLRLQIWFYVCSGNAFECVSSCIQNKPSSYWLISSAKASVICIWHTLLGLSQLTVWLLHAWPLVPCRVLILYHLLSILSYSRMMQSLENMLRSPPAVCIFYKRFAASIIALSYMVGWTCERKQICEHSLLW